MAITLDQSYVTLFESEVKHSYQQASKLMGTCRTRTGVVGSTVRFPKIGKGMAQPRIFQSDVIPMNVAHSGVNAVMSSWVSPEYSDIFMQAQVNFDERRELVKTVSTALGRRLDQIMLDDALAQAAANAVAVGVGGNNAMNVGKMRAAKKAFDANGVPSSDRHLVVSATAMQQLLGSTQITSMDYNAVRSLVNGDLNTFLGFNVHMIEDRLEGGLPLTGVTRTCYAYHKDAIGLGIGLNIKVNVDYVPEKTSHLVCGQLMAGAINIDDEGICAITIDESVEIN